MPMSQDSKDDIFAIFGIVTVVAIVLGAFLLCGYLSYINGEFSGACKYAGGEVTDSVCIDGDTVLFTYDNWNE